MSIRLNLGTRDQPRQTTIDREPDHCAHCRRAGRQNRLGPVIAARDRGARGIWVAYSCPIDDCNRPFFAIYHENAPTGYGADFNLARLTPLTNNVWNRSKNVEAISPEFYDIMDQALAAEEHRLPLVAGMGYRKALEFLIKDYVTRKEQNALEGTVDPLVIAKLEGTIAQVRKEPLAATIRRIEDARIKMLALRCAWLGNDESHYTRLWNNLDIKDLTTILRLVMDLIDAEATAAEMIARMPDPADA